MLSCPDAFSEGTVGECGASFELEESVGELIHGISTFQVFWGIGSEVGFKLYALGFDYLLLDSGLG